MNQSNLLIEQIIQCKVNIQSLLIDSSEESIHQESKKLFNLFKEFKNNFSDEFNQFLKENSQFKPLEVMLNDEEKGYEMVINVIQKDKTDTFISLLKLFQTNTFYQWSKRNVTSDIEAKCENEADRLLFSKMSLDSLPKIKKEKMGDCLVLAYIGHLSDNYEIFSNPKLSQEKKSNHLQALMYEHRKYIKWNFDNLSVSDETSFYHDSHYEYTPRGLAAKQILDSSYIDEKNKELVVVLSTSNSNTSSQGAQAFETFYTLQQAYLNDNLVIGSSTNLKPNIMLFNQAFFCTQNAEEVTHSNAHYDNVDDYHHRSHRKIFDNYFDKPLEKQKLDKLNGLVTLSMLGNAEISWPRFPHTFDICDLIYCNPVTAGSDTLWLYTKFEQLKTYLQPKRSENMFEFLLDYANETIDSLLEINTQYKQEKLLFDISQAYGRMLSGIVSNFNSYNLKRDLSDSELDKIEILLEKVEAYNEKQPNHQITESTISALSEQHFKRRAKSINRSQDSRSDELKANTLKNEEEAKFLFEQKQKEKKALEDNRLPQFNEALEEINELTKQLYKKPGSKGKTLIFSEFIKNAYKMQEKVRDTGYAFSTIINYLNQGQIKDEIKPHYHSNYILSSGIIRKNFNHYCQEVEKTNPAKAEVMQDCDLLLSNFLRSFETKEGFNSLIQKGTVLDAIKILNQKIKEKLAPYSQLNEKETLDSQSNQKDTSKINDKKCNNSSFLQLINYSYEKSNLTHQWKDALKFSNNGYYQKSIYILAEYLKRIKDTHTKSNRVEGLALNKLREKIYVLQSFKLDDKTKEQLNIIKEGFNYYAKEHNTQNQSKKNYSI